MENGSWGELLTDLDNASQFPFSFFQFGCDKASLEKAPESQGSAGWNILPPMFTNRVSLSI